MKKLVAMLAFGMAGALIASAASAGPLGIPAKLKAGKVQGNLVPAYYPVNGSMNTSGTGDDEDDSPALNQPAGQRSNNCTFTQGKFKAQVGKDAAVALKGVTCGGTAFTGTLCAHTKVLATIMNEDIDKTGATAGATCTTTAGDIAGNTNFVTGNIGTLNCSAGSCSGTLPTVIADPCPATDKVAELRRLEVFDGPAQGSAVVLGTSLKVCCGPKQTFVGGIPSTTNVGGTPCAASTTTDEANGGTQDVLGEMGTVTQGVAP